MKKESSSKIDWGKYGLKTDDVIDNDKHQNPIESDNEETALNHSHAAYHNELFTEDQVQESTTLKPWWKTNFFISEPILFGVWDGVFTSCMINIFGVIVFLRSGWIVGEAGIVNSVLIIITVVIIILASVFAGIGICERCPMDRGGVYFLLSHVLGARIGGAIGIVYCFGQAVSAALHSIGFGEAVGQLLPVHNVWIERAIAIAVLITLVVINIAGVIWVIKLQFILLIILLLAALDFFVGSFVHTNPDYGVEGYYSNNFRNNSGPGYTENNNWFTIFGVFFPTMTGVFAGINMSGDLRNPTHDIPAGTLSAVGVCFFLYLLFVLTLGATCRRKELLTDYLIAEKVSALGVMFLAGLYISSVSACLATLYGTPRVLQSIAKENAVPLIRMLEKGRGPNQVPIIGIVVVAVLTLLFVLCGEINTLAPLVTMPFLLTYALINYAYFSLAMTFDAWQKRDQRLRTNDALSPTFDKTGKGIASNYGATYESRDLDKLFPERNKLKQKTRTQISSPTSSLISSPDEHSSILSGDGPASNLEIPNQDGTSTESFSDFSKLLEKSPTRTTEISGKSHNWYSIFCNRWISLLGAMVNILIMFLVHWAYALLHISVVVVIYIYIGQANPGVTPGVAEFNLSRTIKSSFLRLIGKTPSGDEQIIVTPLHPGVEIMAAQLTDENEDFASRERYHQSAFLKNNRYDISGK